MPRGCACSATRQGFLHQKVALCDDVGIVSTANLDNRSFRLNFEISLLVPDAGFAGEVATMLERDFDSSEEIDAARLAAISLPLRVASRAARLFAPVLCEQAPRRARTPPKKKKKKKKKKTRHRRRKQRARENSAATNGDSAKDGRSRPSDVD